MHSSSFPVNGWPLNAQPLQAGCHFRAETETAALATSKNYIQLSIEMSEKSKPKLEMSDLIREEIRQEVRKYIRQVTGAQRPGDSHFLKASQTLGISAKRLRTLWRDPKSRVWADEIRVMDHNYRLWETTQNEAKMDRMPASEMLERLDDIHNHVTQLRQRISN